MEQKIDWYKPVQMEVDNPAEVLAVQAEGAWVTWGLKDTAYFFLNNGKPKWASATSYSVENVPEPKVYWIHLEDRASHKITLTPGKPPQIEEIK